MSVEQEEGGGGRKRQKWMTSNGGAIWRGEGEGRKSKEKEREREKYTIEVQLPGKRTELQSCTFLSYVRRRRCWLGRPSSFI